MREYDLIRLFFVVFCSLFLLIRLLILSSVAELNARLRNETEFVHIIRVFFM